MKKADIENMISGYLAKCVTKIKEAPVPAFFVGLGLGIVFAFLGRILIPLLVIVAAVVGGLWLLGEDDTLGTGLKGRQNGKAEDSSSFPTE